MNMENNIARQNADALAALSVVFFMLNDIPCDGEVTGVFSEMIIAHIGRWYMENKGRALNPETEIICDEAIKSAFARAQEIAVLAQISAQTGIGMEM